MSKHAGPPSRRPRSTPDSKSNRQQQAKREGRKRVWKILGMGAVSLGALLVFILGAGIGYVTSLLKGLPVVNAETFQNNSSASVVYDRNGKVIGRFSKDGDRQPITSLDQVSPYLANAFVAAEDKTFYHNIGIDPLAMLRAVKQDILGHGIVSGASTITQETVKLAIFPEQQRTVQRKVQEIALALKVNHILSKQEILTDYMNWVYLGHMGPQNVYGVKSASEILFHKDPRDLNLAESAFLAGIVNNPSYFSPYQFFSHIRDRQHRILGEMLNNGMITNAQYQSALAFNIQKDLHQPSQLGAGKYPYIMLDNVEPLVDRELVQAGLYSTPEQADAALATAGYKIYTSIDLSLQDQVDKVLYNQSLYGNTDVPVPGQPKRMDKYQPGATLIDNRTGGILAIGGGRGWIQDNYDHSDIARPTGSSIKPLVDYGPAFDLHQLTAGSVLEDAPINVSGYKPVDDQNFWYGIVTARQALVDSLNVPAVRVLKMITPEVGTSYLEKMGITPSSRTVWRDKPTLSSDDLHYLSTAIGGLKYGLTVQQMTSAFTVFPNQGIWRQSFLVSKITDRKDNTIFAVKQQVNKVFSPQTTYIMTSILHDVVTHGTAGAIGARLPNQFIAGKTGTTDNLTNGWFIGYTQQYTMGIWMGYDHFQQIPGGIAGVPYNLKFTLWSDIMAPILQKSPGVAPQEPSGVVSVNVCRRSGLLPTDLCKTDKDVYSELFIQGTEPTTTCNVHVQAQYVVIQGKNYLATTNTPPSEVRTGIFLQPPWPVDPTIKTLDGPDYVPTLPDPRGGQVLQGPTSTGSVITLPAPANVIAVPTANGVALSWDAVAGATGYSVGRATSPNGPYAIVAGPITATQFTDTQLPTTPGPLYYQIYAMSQTGLSQPSAPISVTPPSAGGSSGNSSGGASSGGSGANSMSGNTGAAPNATAGLNALGLFPTT